MKLTICLRQAFLYSQLYNKRIWQSDSYGLKNKYFDLNVQQIADMKNALHSNQETQLVKDLHQQFLYSISKNGDLLSIIGVLSFYNKKLECYDVNFWTESVKQIHHLLSKEKIVLNAKRSSFFSLISSLSGLINFGKVDASSIKELLDCSHRVHEILLQDQLQFNFNDYSKLINSFRNFPDQQNIQKLLQYSTQYFVESVNNKQCLNITSLKDMSNFLYSYTRLMQENQEYLTKLGQLDEPYQTFKAIIDENQHFQIFIQTKLKSDIDPKDFIQLAQGLKYFNSNNQIVNELMLSTLKSMKHQIPLKNLIKAIHGINNPRILTEVISSFRMSIELKEIFDTYLKKKQVNPQEFVRAFQGLFGTAQGYELQVSDNYLVRNWNEYQDYIISHEFTLVQLLQLLRIYCSLQYYNTELMAILISKIKQLKPSADELGDTFLTSLIINGFFLKEKQLAQQVLVSVINNKPSNMTDMQQSRLQIPLFAVKILYQSYLDEDVQKVLLNEQQIVYPHNFRETIKRQNSSKLLNYKSHFNIDQELSYLQSKGYLHAEREARFGPYYIDLVVSQLNQDIPKFSKSDLNNHEIIINYADITTDYSQMDDKSLQKLIFIEIDGPYHFAGNKFRGTAYLKSRIFKKMNIKVMHINRDHILSYLNNNSNDFSGFVKDRLEEYMKQR